MTAPAEDISKDAMFEAVFLYLDGVFTSKEEQQMAPNTFLCEDNDLTLFLPVFGKSLNTTAHHSLPWGSGRHLVLPLAPVGSPRLLFSCLNSSKHSNWSA